MNKRGPSMETWGALYKLSVSEDRQPSIYTSCVLLVRYDLNNLTIFFQSWIISIPAQKFVRPSKVHQSISVNITHSHSNCFSMFTSLNYLPVLSPLKQTYCHLPSNFQLAEKFTRKSNFPLMEKSSSIQPT